jgi:hypothetical protein
MCILSDVFRNMTIYNDFEEMEWHPSPLIESRQDRQQGGRR